MMKMISFSFSSYMFMKNMNFQLMLMSIMIMIIFMKMTYKISMNSMYYMDQLSFIMILLTLSSVLLIMLTTNFLKEINYTIIPILLILILTFSIHNIFQFYITFEFVLIPTMILITKSGKQLERLQAGIYLLIYTVSASLPLLVSILIFKNNPSFLMMNLIMFKHNFMIPIMLAFLVKLPMFFTHLWLPKAHVEAPLEGSMILAAILLKLGGYGMIRFIPMCFNKIKSINLWLITISLMGATATSLNCIRQKDLKSLIAYSSVAHMGLVLASISSMNHIGLMGAIIMMIAHGMSSSALFLLVNDLYTKIHSRNILLFKGLMIMMPNMTFWWFMFMAMNISAPPSINTISEIFIMTSLILLSKLTIIPMIMLSLMIMSFSLSLFINIIHNKNEMDPFNPSNHKIFLSLFIHMFPMIFLLMKMEIMYMYNNSLFKTTICGIVNMIMMKYSTNMMFYFLIPICLSMMMMYNNTFISLEIPLLNIYSFSIKISILMDWISMMFISTIMLISSMIIMFSMFYIPPKEHKQFCLLLMMFVFSMGLLIISDNLIFILLGWDGLGLSSYILVVYYQNFQSAASGTITLLSNRVGDIMIILSISTLMINSNWNFNMNKEFNFISIFLLMMAAFSKSAQFPLSAWLPAAMAAPTPISALVHSSTLVTAGIFLLIRTMNYFHPTSMLIMMISSTATAIYAGMAANWEQDMKKIIALSTLSQIAMMMFAVSMKSLILAFFHLITHALFKSVMFLCAGIMIHCSSYQDMRLMSLNNINMPLTQSILGISSMALMGLPFMSGFFSKDSILELMMSSNIHLILSIMMIFSIGLTSSYTFRMIFISNSLMNKSKPYSDFNKNYYSNNAIMIMIPTSITMGLLLLWFMIPNQLFLISNEMKMMIMLTLTLGLMTGLNLSFKNKKHKKMGESSISMWFTHFLTSYPMKPTSIIMNTMNINDKMWQEMYGPNGFFISMINSSSTTNMLKMSLLSLMIIMTMTPLMM